MTTPSIRLPPVLLLLVFRSSALLDLAAFKINERSAIRAI